MPSVQKDGTVWKKRILLPLWIVRMGLMGILLVLTVLVLAVAARQLSKGDDGYLGDIDGKPITLDWKAALAISIIFLLLIFMVFLLDVLCILKFLHHSLTPKYLIMVNTISSVIWIVQVGLEIWDMTRGSNAGGLVGTLFVTATFIIMLIYAYRVKRQQKRGGNLGDYHPAVNPAHPQSWQQQGTTGGHQGQAPYQTGNYEPYGGQATEYQGATEMQTPAHGTASDYYNTGYKSRTSFNEFHAPPTQPREHV